MQRVSTESPWKKTVNQSSIVAKREKCSEPGAYSAVVDVKVAPSGVAIADRLTRTLPAAKRR
jgi:hypothetical protein